MTALLIAEVLKTELLEFLTGRLENSRNQRSKVWNAAGVGKSGGCKTKPHQPWRLFISNEVQTFTKNR
jgi:hypothetical protein